MSKVSMTVQQITDLGLKDKVFEYLGINPYALNEGQIGYDSILEFDTEFKPIIETRLVQYEVRIRPIGQWKNAIEVPKEATDEQIKQLILDDCEFYLFYDTTE